jgi:hemerythrin-like domain-containing protein
MAMLAGPRKPATPGDAVELLLECHARIRSFLDLARHLGGAQGAADEAVADAAFRVSRYFTLALPLHARDEEESVVPRLRGRDPAVDAELEAMVREHREHERPLRALVAACADLARDPSRHDELAATVTRSAAELDSHFAAHLAREEAVIFPAIRRLLDQTADAAVVKEIRLRRRGVADFGEPAARR